MGLAPRGLSGSARFRVFVFSAGARPPATAAPWYHHGMKRRIFIAIDLPPELKQDIATAIHRWHWLPIRWLKPENWHATVIPPVYLEDAEVELLVAALRVGRAGKSVPLRFRRITLAPPGMTARMIWLEGETPPGFPGLKKRIEAIWSGERRLPPLRTDPPLRLHVTLARFEPGDLRELEAKTRVLGEVEFAFEARSIAVMESRLTPSGAEYTSMASIALD